MLTLNLILALHYQVTAGIFATSAILWQLYIFSVSYALEHGGVY